MTTSHEFVVHGWKLLGQASLKIQIVVGLCKQCIALRPTTRSHTGKKVGKIFREAEEDQQISRVLNSSVAFSGRGRSLAVLGA